jgi:hypothetical protein
MLIFIEEPGVEGESSIHSKNFSELGDFRTNCYKVVAL